MQVFINLKINIYGHRHFYECRTRSTNVWEISLKLLWRDEHMQECEQKACVTLAWCLFKASWSFWFSLTHLSLVTVLARVQDHLTTTKPNLSLYLFVYPSVSEFQFNWVLLPWQKFYCFLVQRMFYKVWRNSYSFSKWNFVRSKKVL